MTDAVPWVSVIIPAHNAAATLGATLDSLAAQGVAAWEAIVVDDGSTDTTAAITASIAQRDPRVRLMRQSRGGASQARNAGLACVRADRIMFLDADDWIAATYLARMLAAMDENPAADVLYCAYHRVLPNGIVSAMTWAPDIARNPFVAFARRSASAIHCFVVRRHLVVEVGGFDTSLKTCEDWDLWQRVARTGALFAGIPEGLAFYRMRRGSLSDDPRQLVIDALTVIDRGSRADPRVPNAKAELVGGLDRSGEAESAACFVSWCVAAQAARGQGAAELLDLLPRVPDLKDGVEHVCDSVFDGLLIGSQGLPAQLTELWGLAKGPLHDHFDRLERVSSQVGLARRLTAALETRLLRLSDLPRPIPLSTTLGMRVNIDAPEGVDPPVGIDSLYMRFCAGTAVLGDAVVPIWGRLSRREVLELACETLGFWTVYERSRWARRPGYWSSVAAEVAVSGLRAAAVGLGPSGRRRAPMRGQLRGLRRRAALRAAGPPAAGSPGRDSSRDAAERILAAAIAEGRASAGRAPAARRAPVAPSDLTRSDARQRLATRLVPILMYHRVATAGPLSLARHRVTPEQFEQQMRLLRRHGFHAISSQDLARHMENGRPLPGRPVLITFDGYKDFHDAAWPILRRYDFSAEVFLVADRIGQRADWGGTHDEAAELMNWREIETLRAEGVRFGSHLATHRAADGLSSAELLREGAASRAMIEERLGDEVRAVAYPFGLYDERVVRVLKHCGYGIGFTTRDGFASIHGERMALPRVAVEGGSDLAAFAERIGITRVEGRRPADPAVGSALVTVIVPAYNASQTIGETLSSIRAQTHEELEVLVVDDGSTDGTADIVLGQAAIDPRIRLIRQANGGVAAARNRGIAEAKGEYIAPIDADDLWRPEKIARQLQAMRAGGERVGLVYCWYALIDEKSRVISLRHRPTDEGDVLERMCLGNVVGNGSAALMRKSVLREVGGYDQSLRARAAQGCEDLKLHLQIAGRHHFAVVKDHLIGYRRTSASMSSDVSQMIRSYDLVVAEFREIYPQYVRQMHDGRNYVLHWLLATALRLGRFRAAVMLIRMMLAHDRNCTLFILTMMPGILARNALAPGARRLVKAALSSDRRADPWHFLAGNVVLPT